MAQKLEGFEVTIILATLGVRAVLAGLVGFAVVFVVKILLEEIGGEDSDPAMVSILTALATSLSIGLGILLSAISHNVLEYLKDRLGTRGKAEDNS